MGELVMLTTFVGMVSATARLLYRNPIQWSEAPGEGREAQSVRMRDLS